MAGDSSRSEAVAKAKKPPMVKGGEDQSPFSSRDQQTEIASRVTFDLGKHFYYYYFVLRNQYGMKGMGGGYLRAGERVRGRRRT